MSIYEIEPGDLLVVQKYAGPCYFLALKKHQYEVTLYDLRAKKFNSINLLFFNNPSYFYLIKANKKMFKNMHHKPNE